MKLHLVDGTYELFRSYFAVPSLRSQGGQEVGALRGMLQTLLVLLRQHDVTHIACAFDHTIESFRNELFPGYKTSVGIPEELLAQFVPAEEAVRALGIVAWPMTEFEADDAIATAVARWQPDERVEQLVICSPDKDFAQVVSGAKVVCWDRRRDILIDEEAVRAKFGISPASIPDYLALVGDQADGIPGMPGWGAKSASQLLQTYHHIEAIPRDSAQWQVKPRSAETLAATLANRYDAALMYKKLATLRSDVPLAETLDELKWSGAPMQQFTEFCTRLGFQRLANQPPKWAK